MDYHSHILFCKDAQSPTMYFLLCVYECFAHTDGSVIKSVIVLCYKVNLFLKHLRWI